MNNDMIDFLLLLDMKKERICSYIMGETVQQWINKKIKETSYSAKKNTGKEIIQVKPWGKIWRYKIICYWKSTQQYMHCWGFLHKVISANDIELHGYSRFLTFSWLLLKTHILYNYFCFGTDFQWSYGEENYKFTKEKEVTLTLPPHHTRNENDHYLSRGVIDTIHKKLNARYILKLLFFLKELATAAV